MRNAALIIGIGLGLSAGQASAQSVTYDYAKGTDFTRFQTYAWAPGTPVPDEFNHERVVSAVEEQLAARGLRKADTGARPDVLVAYHANFERDLQIRANSSDWGPRFYGGNRTGTARVEELLTGTLLVEMFDVEAGAVAWRGLASREVDMDANPEKRTKNIRKTTEKLFRNYPPEKRGKARVADRQPARSPESTAKGEATPRPEGPAGVKGTVCNRPNERRPERYES